MSRDHGMSFWVSFLIIRLDREFPSISFKFFAMLTDLSGFFDSIQ